MGWLIPDGPGPTAGGRDSAPGGGGVGSNKDLGADERRAGAESHTESGGGGMEGTSPLPSLVTPGCGGTTQGSWDVGSFAGSHGGVPLTWTRRTVEFWARMPGAGRVGNATFAA